VKGDEGEELPPFARGFPDDPALLALVRAFERGDYARVRRDAPALAKSAEGDDVRRAATELVTRTKADPMMIALLVITAALLAALTAYWEAKGR